MSKNLNLLAIRPILIFLEAFLHYIYILYILFFFVLVRNVASYREKKISLTWNFKVKSDVSETEMRFTVEEHSGSSKNGNRSPSAERVLFVNERMKQDSLSKHRNPITFIFRTKYEHFWPHMRSLGNKMPKYVSYMRKEKKYSTIHISLIDWHKRPAHRIDGHFLP